MLAPEVQVGNPSIVALQAPVVPYDSGPGSWPPAPIEKAANNRSRREAADALAVTDGKSRRGGGE